MRIFRKKMCCLESTIYYCNKSNGGGTFTVRTLSEIDQEASSYIGSSCVIGTSNNFNIILSDTFYVFYWNTRIFN